MHGPDLGGAEWYCVYGGIILAVIAFSVRYAVKRGWSFSGLVPFLALFLMAGFCYLPSNEADGWARCLVSVVGFAVFFFVVRWLVVRIVRESDL